MKEAGVTAGKAVGDVTARGRWTAALVVAIQGSGALHEAPSFDLRRG